MPTAAQAAAQALYPDLKSLPPRDLRFDTTNVNPDADVPNPDPSEEVIHDVLRFTTTVWNAGEGEMIVGGIVDGVGGPARQEVRNADGDVAAEYDVGSYIFHAAHDHYHFTGWNSYELWTKAEYDAWLASGRDSVRHPPMRGTKTSSCVMDEEFIATRSSPFLGEQAPFPGVWPSTGCNRSAQNTLSQGLSPGWGDTYDHYRFEQWIDLDETGPLSEGQYVLRTVADPENRMWESPTKLDPTRESQEANEATVTFTVGRDGEGRPTVVDTNAPGGTVLINGVDETTSRPEVTVRVLGRDDVFGTGRGVTRVRLSNDGINWREVPYTDPGNSQYTAIPWSLATDAGGSPTPGIRTVFAQFEDSTGKRSPVVADEIEYDPLTGPYASRVVSDDPLLYCRLDATTRSDVDAADPERKGSYRGLPRRGVPGLVLSEPDDRAVSFDGLDDHLALPDVDTGPDAVTVEAWVRPDALPAAGAFASVVSKPDEWSLQFNGPQLEFTLIDGNDRHRLQAPPGALVPGRRHHVAGTFDGTHQRLYVDGVEVVPAAAPPQGLLAAGASSVFVAAFTSDDEFLAGTVDDVAVYPTALSGARVRSHYRGAIDVPAPDALTANAPSDSTMALRWDDNSNGETSFVLEWSGAPDFASSRAVTLPADTVAHDVTGLRPVTDYFFRVRAVRTVDGDTELSPWSNVAEATTRPTSSSPGAPVVVAPGLGPMTGAAVPRELEPRTDPPVDRRAPRLTTPVTATAQLSRPSATRPQLVLNLHCSEGCSAVARGSIRIAGRGYRLPPRRTRLSQNGRPELRFSLSRALAARLRKALHARRSVTLRLSIRVTDASGNAVRRTYGIGVKAPRGSSR